MINMTTKYPRYFIRVERGFPDIWMNYASVKRSDGVISFVSKRGNTFKMYERGERGELVQEKLADSYVKEKKWKEISVFELACLV